MDAFEAYRSPSAKVEPSRWIGREAGREDNIDRAPVNDGYRRRSPGKTLIGILWLISSSYYRPCLPFFSRNFGNIILFS